MIFHEQQHQTSFLTIRPCREEEVFLVAALASQWEREQITTGFRADDPEVLRTKLGPFFLLALRGDEVIGFVIASQQEAAPGEMAVSDPLRLQRRLLDAQRRPACLSHQEIPGSL